MFPGRRGHKDIHILDSHYRETVLCLTPPPFETCCSVDTGDWAFTQRS